MKKIKVNKISTNFDTEGNIESISVAFNEYNYITNFNAEYTLMPDDLEKGKTFDDMTPKMLEKLARQKLSENILLEKDKEVVKISENKPETTTK